MWKILKKQIILFVLVFGMSAAGGCTATEGMADESPVNLVIVGGTQRANQPDFSSSEIRDEIMQVCLTHGTVSIVAVDGKPYLVGSVDIPEPKTGLSNSKYRQIAESQARQIMGFMEENKAVTDEADLLSALQLASRELNAHDGKRKMIIADSGLSTKGYINFASLKLMSLDADNLIQHLKDEEAIPDFSGCEAFWIGIGDVAGEQPELLPKERKRLREIWVSILTEAGVQPAVRSDVSVYQEPGGELPDVSIVPVFEPELVSSETGMDVKAVFEEEKVIVFDEEVLNFKAGTDELLSDERHVRKLLEPVTEYLRADASNNITLIGTTASAGTDAELLSLSLDRCDTLKRLLLACEGVNSSQIEICGLGYKNAKICGLTLADTDECGNFVEEIGRQNRQVFITYSDSELAQRIRKTSDFSEGGND